jgi:hypothetical protein
MKWFKQFITWWKNRKLRRAIRKANRLHKYNHKRYYVFRIGKKYHVVSRADIKLNKKNQILPNSLNSFESLKRAEYKTPIPTCQHL